MSKTCVRNYFLRGGCKLSFAKRLRKFHTNDAGSVTVFSLYLMMAMVVIGSLGLFIMRAEYRRTTVQYTMDRAILAAASVTQTIPPLEVVNDYFAKAHMDRVDTGISVVPNIVVETGLSFKKVSVDTAVSTSPILFGMFTGADDIVTPISGTAIDGLAMVEVSLVLDVSGSMNDNKRLKNLKVAAKEFIDTMLVDSAKPDTISISIVPFSTQVNAGADLLGQYSVTDEHDYSNCVNFAGADFDTTELPTDSLMKRTGHFSPWGAKKISELRTDWKSRICPPDASREIIPVSGNPADLKAYIDAFEASGNTSADIGLKWGATLLDPKTRPVVGTLIGSSNIASKYAGRPHDYTEDGVLKVIVLMTDGKNTEQYFLQPQYRDQLSNIWRIKDKRGATYYSIKQPDEDEWFYSRGRLDARGKLRNVVSLDQPAKAGAQSVVQLTFAEVWNQFNTFHAAYMFQYADENDLDDEFVRIGRYWWSAYPDFIKPSIKDDRMDAICTAAKNNNVLIFTIGFEVTNSNAEKLQACATTNSHFFRVEGVEISDAFAAIAAQLNRVRLTR